MKRTNTKFEMRKGLLLLFFAIATLGFGQNNAEQLLDEVSKKTASYKTIEIEFLYKLDNMEENIHSQKKGNVSLKGDKYFLNLFEVDLMFDGAKKYTINHEDEEVIIETPEEDEEGLLSPSKMLTFYKKGYTYKMDIQKNTTGRKIQYVKLIPIDSNAEVKYILLGIDVKTKNINDLIEVGKNGTNTSIVITNMKTNTVISDKLFNFDLKKYQDDKNYLISEL
ncbi:LolA family protein [Aureivirga sp. CE67]|uniref:LolA family protein n=1 Tax=Aureivirga sp. CE67 TaxID=1788983 RepID=UPI001E4CFEEC|nr:outer membrane lipoprotein carrier protein LolA [Aureivirga sp. CE67]